MSDGEREVDLFGAPVSQIRERWGRPAFKKTVEHQQLVATLRAAGWSQARIAKHMGCDEKTLRKNFSRELEHGADLIEAMCLQVLMARMRAGHGSSTKELLAIIERKGRPAPPVPQASPVATLGKKERAVLAASQPTEGWGDVLQLPPKPH